MSATVEMPDEDLEIIERFASGEEDLREQAVDAHRRNIPLVGPRGNAHQKFMAEVDTPSPDHGLRRAYRVAVIAAAAQRASVTPKP